ncbi:hypothetical protein [Enhygromyxa salina]|uniref:hypothetical protein n=1 Tax=Enhygromyxa salina TaxID=215803 RepID=UPI0011B21152|nr:hypothetical protein [Enhygromyxa salina]
MGAAVCAGSLIGCDAPESGSLENAKNRKAEALDYSKLDYQKIDYNKIDYQKIDYSRLDPAKLDPAVVGKLSEAELSKLASKNIGLVPSENVSNEVTRRLNNRRVAAEKAGDKELLVNIDRVLEAIKLSTTMIGEEKLCW